jgi:HK97 family phage major capsid protein
VSISREAVEDAPVDELNAVGRSLVRGLANKIDATFFSNAAAGTTPPSPAGILHGVTADATPADAVAIADVIEGIGAIESSGGSPSVIWANPGDLTAWRVASLTGGYTMTSPAAPGIEQIGGVRVVPTPHLAVGTVIIADVRFVLAAVRRDARAEFSDDALFSSDGIACRVTCRIDWAVSDRAGIYVAVADTD